MSLLIFRGVAITTRKGCGEQSYVLGRRNYVSVYTFEGRTIDKPSRAQSRFTFHHYLAFVSLPPSVSQLLWVLISPPLVAGHYGREKAA